MRSLALTLLTAAVLPAQEAREMNRLDTTLDGVWRDRQDLRGEQPIELVGLEQAGNGFRERTPLLAQADTTPARIDEGELHARRMAILAGETFDVSPLPRLDAPPPGPQLSASPRQDPPAERSSAVVVVGVFAALLLWAWRSARGR